MGSHRSVSDAAICIAAAALAVLTVAPSAHAQTAVPEIGTEVVVAFLHGDLDRPIVIGALWDSAVAPPERATVEADLRQALATRKLKISPAEIAGAVSRALALVSRRNTWTDTTAIRGCGPAGELCFVITCRRCGGNN